MAGLAAGAAHAHFHARAHADAQRRLPGGSKDDFSCRRAFLPLAPLTSQILDDVPHKRTNRPALTRCLALHNLENLRIKPR
jgi:hypothetical protein